MDQIAKTPYQVPKSDLGLEDSLTGSQLVIKSPRSPVLEFILHYSTFGVYTGFWFVGRVQEFKKLNNVSAIPWLWFFVPHVFLAQLVALPKFIDQLRTTESKNNIEPWAAWGGGWIASVLLLTGTFNLLNSSVFPDWVYLPALVAWGIVFSVIQGRINNLKNHLQNVTFIGGYKKYNVIEWIVVVILLPFSTLVVFILSIEPLLVEKIGTLNPNSTYEDINGNYSFPIIGNGWNQVSVGTYSDGAAEFEAQGPVDGMYLLVFKHGVDDNLNSIAAFRTFDNYESAPGVACTETRRFSENNNSIISNIFCEGRYFGDPILQAISIIETDAGIFELYGEINTVRSQFDKHSTSLKRIVRGFKPL